MKKKFKGMLIGRGPGNAWVFLPIPAAVAKVFGTKARVPICGTINGFPFRTSLLPEGDGTHAMPGNKEMMKGARVVVGQSVAIVIEADTAPRGVDVPDDMSRTLAESRNDQIFGALSYSKRKEFVDWIEQAKRSETRAKRLREMPVLLAQGRSPKS
jgi:hypothetical protein